MMKISKSDLNIIKELFAKRTLRRGKNFMARAIIKKLKNNGSLKIERLSAQRYKIDLVHEENIFRFFRNYGYKISSIEDIDTYIENVLDAHPSRDTLQKFTGSTKTKTSKSLKGLYLSSLTNLDIKINNQTVNIVPTNGLGYFCFHTQKIEVSKETIIVGVENYQVIWFAKKFKIFFDREPMLFVVRNETMREWISDLENEYIHFGDYDLAGINIYLNEIVPRLKKCKKYSMFIPENIEALIQKYGNNKLFEDQKCYKNLIVKDKKIATLKAIIMRHKRGLEQEGLYTLHTL